MNKLGVGGAGATRAKQKKADDVKYRELDQQLLEVQKLEDVMARDRVGSEAETKQYRALDRKLHKLQELEEAINTALVPAAAPAAAATRSRHCGSSGFAVADGSIADGSISLDVDDMSTPHALRDTSLPALNPGHPTAVAVVAAVRAPGPVAFDLHTFVHHYVKERILAHALRSCHAQLRGDPRRAPLR